MPEIRREWTNFTPGELTYHESVEGAEITAQEMVNLRVGTHGALRQRHPIRAILEPNEANITGVFATIERLYFINSNGKLYFRNRERANQTDTEIEIRGRPHIVTEQIPDGYTEETKLSGRISVIHQYKDFDILTSEGEDQGYWIDTRDEDELVAYPLGFNPPTFDVTFDVSGSGLIVDDNQGFADVNLVHFYRFTYIRNVEIGADINTNQARRVNTPDGLQIATDMSEEPFNNVESNPSEAVSTQDVVVPYTRRWAFYISGLTFPNADGQEQGIAIYRSRPIRRSEIENDIITLEDENLDYRLVGVYPPPIDLPRDPGSNPPDRQETARFDDFMHEDDRAEQQLLRFDNDRLPSTVKQFTIYNDRIYAPNRTELRYSDIRFGNLTHWAFPEVNAIRQPVDCVFAQQYRDMLLFGGRNGLWRLTGIAEYSHDIDRISNLGPITPYSTTTNEDIFGYISPAGLHVTTGAETQNISEPIQSYFENQQPVDGSILYLPNGHSVWSVVFSRLGGSLKRQTFMRARQWQQWNNIELQQNTLFQEIRITHDVQTTAYIAENTQYLRKVLWENIRGSFDGVGGEETTDDLPAIEWSWKSQRLDFDNEGIATRRKRFTELIIEGKAASELTINFYIYDTENNVTENTVTATLDKPHLYKTRVPIQKIGQAIEFKVAGTGNVDMRSFCLKGHI